MNFIIKYKKTIILLLVIVLTIATVCGLLAFRKQVIKCENDNPNFCYSAKELADSSEPLKYSNVKEMAVYDGEFSKIALSIEGYTYDEEKIENISGSTKNFCVDTKNGEKMQALKVYYYLNCVDEKLDKYIPVVRFENNEGVLKVSITGIHFQAFGNINSAFELGLLLKGE